MGVLANWTIKTQADAQQLGTTAAAQMFTVNAAVSDIRQLRKEVNRLNKTILGLRAKQAAVDSVKALQAQEFPGVLPALWNIFFGRGKKGA